MRRRYIQILCLMLVMSLISFPYIVQWPKTPDNSTQDTLDGEVAFTSPSPTFSRGTRGVGDYDTWLYEKEITITEESGSDLTDYQVKLEIQGINESKNNYINWSHMNDNGSDIRFQNWNKTENLYYWIESWNTTNATIWVKVLNMTASENTTIYMYYGRSSATSESNDYDTFIFGDDFDNWVSATYYTDWINESNPLWTVGDQGWHTDIYSNYSGEDRIYIFIQNESVTGGNNTIECLKINRTDANDTSEWVDEGVVFTTTQDWSIYWLEPHGIFFETQAMADAREGVDPGLGTPKWRMYYCGLPSGGGTPNYQVGFAYADESDLTSWTEYSGNPVYNITPGTYGAADPKACIYNDEVWMCIGNYTSTLQEVYFTVSPDGISNWTDKTRNWINEVPLSSAPVPFSNGILVTGRKTETIKSQHFYYYTTDGNDKITYSGNPMSVGGGSGAWDENMSWSSIVVDKNASANLGGHGKYYRYYMGNDGTNYYLGLNTTTTVTIENGSAVNETIWESNHWIHIVEGELTLHHDSVDKGWLRSWDTTIQYKALRFRVRPESDDLSQISFKNDTTGGGTDQETWSFNSNTLHRTISESSNNLEYTDISPIDLNWTTYDIIWESGSAKFYRNGTLKDTDTTQVCSISRPVLIYAHTTNSLLHCDWIIVRNYTDPEPTVDFGTETRQPQDQAYNITLIKDTWNFRGYTNSTTTNSTSLYSQISNCSVLVGKNLSSGYWYTYAPSWGITESWNISFGDGLFIMVSSNATWQIYNHTLATNITASVYNPVVYSNPNINTSATIFGGVTNITALIGKNSTTGYWYTYAPSWGITESWNISFGDGLFILTTTDSTWDHT